MFKHIGKLLLVTGIILAILLFLEFRPIYSPQRDECATVNDTITYVGGGGVNDIVFKLNNDPSVYYINRGTEKGLSIDSLSVGFKNKMATITFINHWRPLGFNTKVKHITEIQQGDSVYYSEF